MRPYPMLMFGVLLVVPLPSSARSLRVRPGDSIQAAVDTAGPGDTILIAPGTYREAGRPCPAEPGETCAVVVEQDGLRLIGEAAPGRPVVLENAGGQAQGISIARSGDPACLTDPALRIRGVTVSGLTVVGFDGDGIFLFCADDWRVTRSAAHDDAEYGIFPSHCGPGRVDHSIATGANDTGIYIGQSHDVRVDHNLARGNVSGFEIENCTGVRLDHNEATGNTGGILSFTLPFLDVKQNVGNTIEHNVVRDNNKPNTCLDPEDAVCGVPVGTGILVLAADRNLVRANTVTGNGSYGIAVADFCVAQNIPPEDCALLDIQPSADGNRIVANGVTGNGSAPDPRLAPVFAVDLAWDTTGSGSCWARNVYGTEFPPELQESVAPCDAVAAATS